MIVHWCRKRVYHQHYYIYVYVHVDTSILMLIYIVFTTNSIFQPFVLWNQKTIKCDFSVTFFVWKKVCGRNLVACTYFHVKHWFRYHLCPAFRRLLVCVLSLSDLYWNDNKNKLWNKGSFYYSMPYFYILPWGIILLPNHRFMTLTAFIIINFIFLFIP